MSKLNLSHLIAYNRNILTRLESRLPKALQGRRFLLAGGMGAIVAVIAITLSFSGSPQKSTNGPTAAARRGPMTVSVTETGEVQAEKKLNISNELQWPVVIKSVVSEGTVVKEGDVVVEFECKELVDSIEQQELTITSSDNSYVQARENLQLKTKTIDRDRSRAQQALEDSKKNLERYTECDWPIQLNNARSEVALQQQNLHLAKAKLEFKLKANADPELGTPYSQNDIEAEKLGVDRLEQGYQRAVSELDKIQKYDYPTWLARLKIAVDDAGLELEKVRIDTEGQLRVAQADEKAKKSAMDRAKRKLEELQDNQAKLVNKATKEGLVVYSNESARWGSSQTPVEVGSKIEQRRQLMFIPDMTTLEVKTKVNEDIIDQVRPGLEAFVRFDARPDRTFKGKIKKVAPLPDSKDRWLNPNIKVFEVIILLDEQMEGLKPNMTCQVEMVLARLDDVLTVPVAAVFTEQEQRFCHVVKSGESNTVPVKIGRINNEQVEIISGLNAGDTVMLAPPASTGSTERASGMPMVARGSPVRMKK